MAGTMLGDGIRYASIRNVRRKRNSRTAPPIPLTFSQRAPRRCGPDFDCRTAATVFLALGVAAALGVTFFFFVVAIVWVEAETSEPRTEFNYALGPVLL